MPDNIIRPDLEGREHLSPQQERFCMIRKMVRAATGFAAGWTGILVVVLVPSIADGLTGWPWALVKCAGLAAAAALSSLRLHLRRWSWLAFAAALAVHGCGLYACLGLGDVDTEEMGFFSLEIIMLAALLVLHGLWSLQERRIQKEDNGK